MRYFFVQNDYLVGLSDGSGDAPNGFTCVPYDGDEPYEHLYYNGSKVALIPPAPDESSVWDGKQWVSAPQLLAPVQVVRPLTQTLPETATLMQTVQAKLLGKSVDEIDKTLLLLAVTVLSLYNLKSEPDLLAYALEVLEGYVNGN